MKVNHWTLALAAAGVVSFGAVAQAEEANEQVKTLVSGTTISGYVSTSAIWRPGTGNAGYPLGGFHGTGKQDGFNLDVVDITISKAMDESEWAAGYKAEIWYGPDATTYATGGPAHLAIKNAYVSLRAPVGNGIDFKLGVFDTVVGFESANAGDNPNFTRSIGWAVEPTTHTGLLASYRFSDMVSVSAGVANAPGTIGTLNTINGKLANTAAVGTAGSESAKQYLAAINLTAPDGWGFASGSTLTLAAINTPRAGSGVVQDQEMTHVYAGLAMNTPIEAWKVGLAYDYVFNPGDPAAVGHASSYQSVWGLYNSYQVTEKLKLNLRGEYATGSAGLYTGLAPAATDDDQGEAFVSITGTVDYALWENVISRLEMRWDTSVAGGSNGLAAGANPSNPFGGTASGTTGADEKNAFLVALNVIYKF